MTREMYESLGVLDLRAIAKTRGIKLPAGVKKADIIDRMVKRDQEDAAAAASAPAPVKEERKSVPAKEAKAAPAKEEPVVAPAEETPAQETAKEAPRKAPTRKKVVRVVTGAGAAPVKRTLVTSQTAPVHGHTEPAVEDVSVLEEEPARKDKTAAPAQEQTAATTSASTSAPDEVNQELDSGAVANGILEVMPDGFGFIRSKNYMPGEDDVYVAPSQIRRFNLKTGDILTGSIRIKTQNEKFSALLYVKTVNGRDPESARKRRNFEDMTPIFPEEKIRLESPGCSVAMRVMDIMCPVGKGQRGMIVSPPKAGKTTLLKEVARSIKINHPECHLIILLIDERPEEVTDIREAIAGPNVEVIYSTFDELPEHHKKVSEMTIERAKRLVEQQRDVVILLDSITRLTRAYNLTEPASGRTLTGGLDPAALHMPKRFFGAARNIREGGSLTILATALIETGSKMDDVVYEEFKGTGNMEMILNRKLQERRIFPAVDLAASGTRRDDLLLTPGEREAADIIHRLFIGGKAEQATDSVLDAFSKTRTNGEFVAMVRKHQWAY